MVLAGGVKNDSPVIAYTVTSAVPYAGMIVKGTSTTKTVDLAGSSSDEPVGYTYTSSRDNFMLYTEDQGTAKAAATVGIHALIEGQLFNAPVDASNLAIAIGDKVVVDATGYVDKYTNGAAWILGVAETALGATAGIGNYVTIRISKRYVSA